MTEAELQQENLILEEIHELSKYLDGIPEAIRATGLFAAYQSRLAALQEEVIQRSLASLKNDKTALSVVSLYDDNSDEKPYWLSLTPAERLRHVEILRRINYGTKAVSRMQRVFEIVEFPKS